MADAAAGYYIPPPSSGFIALTSVELVCYVILLAPALWVTWKHKAAGMTWTTILISYFGLSYTAELFLLIHRNDPLVPGVLLIVTNAGFIACLTLAIIGLVYHANMILPLKPKDHNWPAKIIMAITNLINTAGIALATYGGSPSATTGGLINAGFDKAGNWMMLIDLLLVFAWALWSWRHTNNLRDHPNRGPARALLLGALVATPFHLVRLAYGTAYAYDQNPKLDWITGSMAVHVIVQFLMQLGVVVAALWAGWRARNVVPNAKLFGNDYNNASPLLSGREDGPPSKQDSPSRQVELANV
ncbi:hypothetical protein BD289DRAFT_128116 [Coniella lustricola]|uniref:DUF7702 domain-containing protein n=1 Tax=Coniella lustricola TaxID=2025994 RepID=A0A2T2ZW45_9PEZI|nr:hypothetical protein BD289DRAFT_128116 [Coniella lustricola]